MPLGPGVYLFKDIKNKTIYVGKAKNLKKRVSSYFNKKRLDAKTMLLVENITAVEIVRVESEIEAFLLEAELIKRYKPIYNIKFIDDKSYPYIAITKGGSPSILIVRKKNIDAHYFGPYTDAAAVKVVLKIMRRIFPYQSVKNHSNRKCLYYHLGLCPCVRAVGDNGDKYKRDIANIKRFLRGGKDSIINSLLREQKALIKLEKFEDARKIQDKIDKMRHITSPQYKPFRYIEKPDYYLERIKTELGSLNEMLIEYFPELKSLKRIESYDISNIQGKDATGSMVVFINGDKSASEYKRFKIRCKSTPDDYSMMKEIIRRRLKKGDWGKPDLMLIDGGKGQVGAVLEEFKKNKITIPVIGLAKKKEIIIVPIIKSQGITYKELDLANDTPGVNLLRRLRDEAHRFAITYHRLLRKKSFIDS